MILPLVLLGLLVMAGPVGASPIQGMDRRE